MHYLLLLLVLVLSVEHKLANFKQSNPANEVIAANMNLCLAVGTIACSNKFCYVTSFNLRTDFVKYLNESFFTLLIFLRVNAHDVCHITVQVVQVLRCVPMQLACPRQIQ